jgi:hypothetical protein
LGTKIGNPPPMWEVPAMPVKYPEIRVRLAGPANDFCILDNVTKALRKAGVRQKKSISFATRRWPRVKTTFCKFVDSGSH